MSYNCGGKQGNTTRTFVKRWNAIITVVASLKLFFCLEGSSPSLSVWWHLKEEESGLKEEKDYEKKTFQYNGSASNVL